MSVKTIQVADCDECQKEIDLEADVEWIDASVYGVAFHAECWERIGGPRVARVLYLDDVSVRRGQDPDRVRLAMEERRTA